MSDWREIRMTDIDWMALRSHIGRSAGVLGRLSTTMRAEDKPQPFGRGAWKEMTLGQVADIGRKNLLRYPDVGEVAIASLQYVIDMADAGKCPIIGSPAPDALRPTLQEKEA